MERFTTEEVALAARNHGLPLEALRYPLTPVGLHYLLTHYDIPEVDPAAWRLTIGGLVERPRELTLDELRRRTAVEAVVTMECAGNGRAHLDPRPFSQPWIDGAVGTARWRGTPLRPLLEEAGVLDGAVEIVFTALDWGTESGGPREPFGRSLAVADALLRDDILLAYEIDGRPLPPQHGFPLRLLVPGWYGMASVKWLAAIDAVSDPYLGHHQVVAYCLRQEPDDPGEPLTRILPRALMIPPGTPDFPTRRRTLTPGPCTIEGRAWSGWGPIERVELSTDAGRTWSDAPIEHDLDDSPWAWSRWAFTWDAPVGEHELRCRARDAAGNVQPDDAAWNLGGYANNAVQRVPVSVG